MFISSEEMLSVAFDMQIQVAALSLTIFLRKLVPLTGPSCDLRTMAVRRLLRSRPSRSSTSWQPTLLSVPSRLVLCRIWHTAQLVYI